MERDLALIRSKRAERDRAAGLLKTLKPNANPIVKAEEVGGPDIKALGKESETKETEDVVMVDSPLEPLAKETFKTNTSTITMNPGLENPDLVGRGIGQAAKASMTIDTQKPSSPDAPKKEQVLPDQLMETPTTANLGDSAFESMFNDTDNPDGDDMIDFDFSAGANLNQQILNETAFDNVVVNNREIPNLDTTSNEDINSLLPGLENHLNAANNMPTVTQAAASVPDNNANSTVAAPTSAPQGFETAPTESNFDDLFSSSEFIEGTGDFNMTTEGNLDELGDFDDWWRSDET